MRKHPVFSLILFFSFLSFSFAQKNDSIRFESQYLETVHFMVNIHDSLERSVRIMQDNYNLTDVQKAKIDFLRAGIHNLYELDPLFCEATIAHPGSSEVTSLFARAETFIIQSRPNMGIPLLLDYIQTVDENSDSAVYAKIYLAEAHRQLKEYRKGIGMINKILKDNAISLSNRAFACNRIAAMYNEGGGGITKNSCDSVIKYSNRCINISEDNNFIGHLASSQNELAFIYRQRDKMQLSLEYGSKAIGNFIKAEEYYKAMNASINQASTFSVLNKPDEAAKILTNALKFADVNESKVLHMRIYLSLSRVNAEKGDFSVAYEYLAIAREMQASLYNNRIKTQIYDMSAKYNLQEKEIKIIEEQQKSKLFRQQKRYFIIIAIISSLLFVILLILFRFKDSAYKALLKQNLQSQKLSKKLEANIKADKTANSVNPDEITEDEKYFQLGQKLEKFMLEEKPYLFKELSIDDVCKKLSTNRTYLSKAVYLYFSMAFNDLFCDYRVRTARELFTNPNNDHISVEGIGKMSGFHSNSAFHKRFKLSTGLTPNYFRSHRNLTQPE